MGAGASVDKATQDVWKGKIMGATSRQQMLDCMTEMKKAIRSSGITDEDKAATKLQNIQRGRAARRPCKDGMSLQDVFAMFSNYGKSKKTRGIGDKIDNSRFRKMMKNGGFICKGMKNKNGKVCGNWCDQHHVKFCKAGSKSDKKFLHFDDFVVLAIPKFASETGKDPEEFCAILCQNGKPKAAAGGTKVTGSRFYDDKSTWTGVATRGGPSTSGDQITLSGMMNRKEGDLGV